MAMEGEKSTVTMASGEVIQRTEPLIPARTTTKQAIIGVAAFMPIIQGIQELALSPPWLEEFTNSSLFANLALLTATVIVGRFFKTPSDVGKLL